MELKQIVEEQSKQIKELLGVLNELKIVWGICEVKDCYQKVSESLYDTKVCGDCYDKQVSKAKE